MDFLNNLAAGKSARVSYNARTIVALLLILSLIGLSLLLIGGRSAGWENRPGFFGTRAGWLADFNLAAEFAILAGLSLGVFFARTGRIRAHQYTQTSMVLLNLTLSVLFMMGSFEHKVLPGLPGNLRTAFGAAAGLHGILGGVATLCSLYLLLRMNRLLPARWRISHWKNLMRLTFGLYWATGMMGIVLYAVWYIR